MNGALGDPAVGVPAAPAGALPQAGRIALKVLLVAFGLAVGAVAGLVIGYATGVFSILLC